MQIKTIADIPSGSLVFKDTNFDDEGKPLLMKLANAVTSLFQKTKGKDHTEKVVWYKNRLYTYSSVYGAGVRLQLFEYWRVREGYPEIEILIPPVELSTKQEASLFEDMLLHCGLPYGLSQAIKSKDKRKEDGKEEKDRDLIETGIFCSETSSKSSGFENWQHDWPLVTYNKALSYGYTIGYKSESKAL